MIICIVNLILALFIVIVRRWSIEKVMRKAEYTLAEMQRSEARRNRVSDNPFFADITTGNKRKFFLDRISSARKMRLGSESVYTHVSIADGQPGTYMIHYFNMDLSLLHRFQSSSSLLEKEQLRRKILSELFLSPTDAFSMIQELGTAFVDSFLDNMQGVSFDPLGDGPSYVYEMPVESLDQNIPIPKAKDEDKRTIGIFPNKHRPIAIVCAHAFIVLVAAGICIFFSDSFFYSGIAHYRKYVELFGASITEPQYRWPIMFSSLSFILTVLGLHLTMIVVYRGLFPSRTMHQITNMVIHRCSGFILSIGVLLIHYLSCDFTGNRWFLLNHIYQCDVFYQVQAIYYYLHEITPYLLCGYVLWNAIAWSCFSQRIRGICLTVITVLLLIGGMFFLIFDLWLQPWAILPIAFPIVVAIVGIFVANNAVNKNHRKRRDEYVHNPTRRQA